VQIFLPFPITFKQRLDLLDSTPIRSFFYQTFSPTITILIVVNTPCAVSLELDVGCERVAIPFRRLGQLESRSTDARIYRINESALYRGILYFIVITLICLQLLREPSKPHTLLLLIEPIYIECMCPYVLDLRSSHHASLLFSHRALPMPFTMSALIRMPLISCLSL
jgi:hypothetical protein